MIASDIEVFLGLDVGKTDHWACAVARDGTKVWNRILPNDDAPITEVYKDLRTRGTVFVVVDQPANIGALWIAVAQQVGIPVAYLPVLSMRRIAEMFPGKAQTDEKDAYIVGDAARTMPETSRSIEAAD